MLVIVEFTGAPGADDGLPVSYAIMTGMHIDSDNE